MGRYPDGDGKTTFRGGIVCCMTRRSTTFTSTCRPRRRKFSASFSGAAAASKPLPGLRMALPYVLYIAAHWRQASSIRGSLRTRACRRTSALIVFTPGHLALSANSARTPLSKFVRRQPRDRSVPERQREPVRYRSAGGFPEPGTGWHNSLPGQSGCCSICYRTR